MSNLAHFWRRSVRTYDLQLELKFDFSSFISKINSSFVDLLLFFTSAWRYWSGMDINEDEPL